MDTDLDTLATALYVTTDDLLRAHPERVPARPKGSFEPQTSDAEMLTLAVMQAVLGYPSEARWLRYAHQHLRPLFPRLPLQPGYNKRLRTLAHTMTWLIGQLARQVSVATDDVWVVDSTPVECARSRETVKRSDLAGWAEYGYCASHSRYFWGVRLHLVCTLHGLPIAWAITGAKADEREVLTALLDNLDNTAGLDRDTVQLLIADKNYYGRAFEAELDHTGIDLLRQARKGEKTRPGSQFFNRSARSSSQSSTPSKASSTWNTTTAKPPPASPPESRNASSPSPPSSGTTTAPAHPSYAPSPPTTTNPGNQSSSGGGSVGRSSSRSTRPLKWGYWTSAIGSWVAQ